MKAFRWAPLVLFLAAAAPRVTAQAGAQPPAKKEKFASEKAPDLAPWKNARPDLPDTKEAQTAKPYRIFDNVYFVGLQSYSAYLVTTTGGLILIDPTFAHTADLVLDNVRSLGFAPADIKYILVTHGHLDHAAGVERVQAVTHARVGMAAADWDVYSRTPAAPDRKYTVVPRDLVFKDGDVLTLGSTTISFYVTPGHTPGCLSMLYTVYDHGQPHKALTLGGTGLTFGPEWTDTFIKSMERMRAIDGVEVLLPDHPYMADLWSKSKALAVREPGQPNPFVIGRAGVLQWFDAVLKASREKQRIEGSSR